MVEVCHIKFQQNLWNSLWDSWKAHIWPSVKLGFSTDQCVMPTFGNYSLYLKLKKLSSNLDADTKSHIDLQRNMNSINGIITNVYKVQQNILLQQK